MSKASLLEANLGGLVPGSQEQELGPGLAVGPGDYLVLAKAQVAISGPAVSANFRLVLGSAEDSADVSLFGTDIQLSETVSLALATSISEKDTVRLYGTGNGVVGAIRIVAVQLEGVTVSEYDGRPTLDTVSPALN